MRFCFCRNCWIYKHTSSGKRGYESQYWLGQQPELFPSTIFFGSLGQYEWISFIFFLPFFWETIAAGLSCRTNGNIKECKNLKCKIWKAVLISPNYIFLYISNSYLLCKNDQKISVEHDVSCNCFMFSFTFNFIRCIFVVAYFTWNFPYI